MDLLALAWFTIGAAMVAIVGAPYIRVSSVDGLALRRGVNDHG